MTNGDGAQTVAGSVPPESELVMLAELAFASRGAGEQHTQAPRNLVYLSPDALDMDLSDPMQRNFGDYELLEKIGRGGMGVVYRARQRSLDREVALKLLIAGPWAPTQFIERFRREAQSAARLEHPNIVTVYESGSQHDLNYFSMRLVRGESLATLVARQGRLPPREAARILRIVADAVDFAHRLGVLHLDLKPGNVLVDESGTPLVADFGLARRVDHALADNTGDSCGTPSYMAPEQVNDHAHAVGRATDIYGLGGILYELLCDRPPFVGSTAANTLDRVLHEDVQPPRKYDAGIPRDLEAICLKCLHKNPAERYATAADLAEDLRSYLDDRPVSVRQPGPGERVHRWIRREPRLAAAVAAVALALVAGLGATSQQWRRAEANATAARQLIWEGRREAALQLEGDGRGLDALGRLVANLTEQEQGGELGAAELERLRIGLLRGQGARWIDSMVVADAGPMTVAVSPDGTLLALAFDDLSVRWYDSVSLEERGRVSLAEMPTSDGQMRTPMLLRFIDSERLLVTLEWYTSYVNPTDGDSWLVDLNDIAVVEPPADFEGFADATFSADGRHALLRNHLGDVQLWQTTPWVAQSALIEDGGETLVWKLANDGLAFGLGTAMRTLSIHDLRNADVPATRVSLPRDAGISAWMLSSDGRQLALGDFEGRVFILDTASGNRRLLPASRGREITWLSFSEDNAWLAVSNMDGLAQVIDVATGDGLVSGEMRSEFFVRRVGISREQHLLIAAGEGQTAMWRIPRQGPRARAAERIGLVPAPHDLSGRYPIAWSLESGLLASAGMDGQVRLWRLPASPTVPALNARQIADARYPAPDRLLQVSWNQLRLVSLQGRALTRWLSLEQPPGYAELLDEGRMLLVTVGPELRVYDTASMSLRYSPVPLLASPQRLLPSADGRHILLSFGAHGEAGHEEHLKLFDAVAGRWLPGEATLAGPVARFVASPDWRWIAAWTWTPSVGPPTEGGVTSVLSVDDLELVAEYPHDPFEPVKWAAFRDDRLLLVLRARDPRFGRNSLLVWNPETDEVEGPYDIGGAAPESVLAVPEGAIVAGAKFDIFVGADGETRPLPRAATSEPAESTGVMALSPDGRFLARADRFQVQLYDLETGALLGAPLAADHEALNYISKIGFTPDGRAVRAQTNLGRDLHWALEPETADAATLASELAQLLPSDTGPTVLHALSRAEHGRLRAADPGAWVAPAPLPSTAFAANARSGMQVPARAPGTPDELVDLTSVYTYEPSEFRNSFWGFASIGRYPIGVQRIGGVDFDMRGLVEIGALDAAVGSSLEESQTRIECLKLPAIPTAALRLLGWVALGTGVPRETTLAVLTLHYLDESSVELKLRAGIDLRGYAGDDDAVPIVFATDHGLAAIGGPLRGLSAPRLENPYPDRSLECLDLEIAPSAQSLALFAITIEPKGEKSL